MGQEAILGKNLNLFKEMRDLAEKQHQFITMDQMDDFNECADNRDRIREEITKNNNKYEKILESGNKFKTNKNIRHLSMQISEIIQVITQLDGETQSMIEKKKIELLPHIKNMRKSQKIAHGYGNKRTKTPKYIDRKL